MADLQVANETIATFARRTKDGRTLKYEMSILQQPARARACGAGAKSTADRRPVDPPPVVELKIFDGEQDVTFNHNANFFLYTTLESARQMANPKGGAVPSQHPVLTGTPVAGMAYLDRPCHAGYFVFPDLSIRHEGRYRLSFNLFEEVKMDADADIDENSANKDHPSAKLLHRSPANPYQYVNFRLEVKSVPFNVFSAKKFPGLAESTDLSRCVAEQGCRVRIRRDVRIRVRKENKPSNDDFNRESSETRTERFSTPASIDQAPVERSRPSSITTSGSTTQNYPHILAKTPSHDSLYIKQSPHSQHTDIIAQPSAHYPHHSYGATAHHNQPPHTSTVLPPPQQKYPIHTYHPQPTHSRQNSNSSSHDFHRPQQQYSIPPYHHQTQPSRENSGYTVAVDTKYQPQSQGYHSSTAPSPASSTCSTTLPPLTSIKPLIAASPVSYEQPPPPPPVASTTLPAISATKSKRGYGNVFDSGNGTAPVQYGARPETSGQELPSVETDEHGLIAEKELAQMQDMLSYRRADGTKRYMRIPTFAGNASL